MIGESVSKRLLRGRLIVHSHSMEGVKLIVHCRLLTPGTPNINNYDPMTLRPSMLLNLSSSDLSSNRLESLICREYILLTL
jgi:hypothetical protein